MKLSDTTGDAWEQLASEYAKMSENVSRVPIGMMLDRANALSPFSEATGVLDNGCGPGPVMSRLIKEYGSTLPKDCSLTCSDFSEAMIKQVVGMKEGAEDDSPWKRVESKVQNAMDLTEVADESKTHVTAGMVYFMTPDPQKCLSESRRVLKEGGVLSLSCWEGTQWLELMQLVKKVRPDKILPKLPEEWSSTAAVEGELKKAGFKDVESYRVPVEMTFESHQSIVDFFVAKLPHMVAMCKDMSEEDVAKLKTLMVAESKKMDPNAPGKLAGVSLVGIGRK